MFFWELFHFCPDSRMNGMNGFTVYSEYPEYMVFWEIFGRKSKAAAHAGRLASGWKM